MNIVVCIKQVPDTTDARFDPQTGLLRREGQPATLNALDEYAVEEGLRLREKLGGGTVTALTMGPPQAVEALRHCVAMGADEAVLLTDSALAGSDAPATVYALSRALVKMGPPDLILCGAESADGATACVGPGLARALNLPCVTFVRKIESIDPACGKAVVQRIMEEGYDRLEIDLPAVLTVVKEINEPRISSLKGKMRARKYEPKQIAAADLDGATPDRLGLQGSAARVVRTFAPEARPAGVMLEGEPDEVAAKLYDNLKKIGAI